MILLIFVSLLDYSNWLSPLSSNVNIDGIITAFPKAFILIIASFLFYYELIRYFAFYRLFLYK